VKLLNIHQNKLIELTMNFTAIPTKPKKIEEFFRVFKAGNPLLDENIRATPGLVDLCYCGIDLPTDEYVVFRRNKIHYDRYRIKKKEKKKRIKLLKKQLKLSKNGLK
jgi:hypothetical protein